MARYATLQNLFQLGAPESAFRGQSNADWAFTDAELEAGVDAACGHVDSYLSGRFTLPLVTYGEAVTRAVCVVAAYDLLTSRGYNPANQGDDSSQLDKRYRSVEDWLKDVARGLVTPPVTDSSTPTGDDDGNANTPSGGYVVAPRLSDDGDGYVVGAPRVRGW
jgi:phage gp36-like protein